MRGMVRPRARWKYLVFGIFAIFVVLASAIKVANDGRTPTIGVQR